MDQPVCPFLGTFDPNLNRGEHLDYPSFENRCLAIGDDAEAAREPLMLSDQATFCLSQGFHYCPRFQTAQAAGDMRGLYAETFGGFQGSAAAGAESGDLDSDWLQSNLADLTAELSGAADDERGDRRRWGWIGAGFVFLLVFLCAGALAVSTGWQMVSRGLADVPQGRLDTLNPGFQPTQAAVYLVITATSGGATPTTTAGAILIADTPTSVAVFPPAVTATPVPGGNNALTLGNGEAAPGIPDGNVPGQVQLVPQNEATPTVIAPLVNVQQPLPTPPTRRPTPTFEIPTSTPIAEPPTSTPVPLGPPLVIFGAQDEALKPGKCTSVAWQVENVAAVYYEGLGVSGKGAREECIDDETEYYNLVVYFADGSTRVYTTTVAVILPTATPTFTPSFTPRPQVTPTWTPVRPTDTPTPDITYGVTLGVGGSTHLTCSVGQTCDILLITANTGSHPDNITVRAQESGPWPSQICRLDGVCANDSILVSNVGSGYTAEVIMRLDIPANAESQSAELIFQAVSGNSGGAIQSDTLTVEVEVQ